MGRSRSRSQKKSREDHKKDYKERRTSVEVSVSETPLCHALLMHSTKF